MDCSAKLNNIGIQAIVEGKYLQAISLLKEALDVKASLLSCSEELAVDAQQLPQTPCSLLSPHRGPDSCLHSTISRGHEETFVYKRGFFITRMSKNQDAGTSNPTASSASNVMESAALLFNMALAFHLNSTYEGAGSLTSIVARKKAAKLYKMSLGLVKHAAESTGSYNLTEVQVVLGILNNLGEIHHNLGEYDLSARCFSSLSDMLRVAMNMGTPHAGFDCDDWAGLVMNVMLLTSAPKFASAA
jgi:tetratricopeptide (TPR) repeat protein